MQRRKQDDVRMSWGTGQRWRAFEMDDPSPTDLAPPLWKDLVVASAVAGMLWAATLMLFR